MYNPFKILTFIPWINTQWSINYRNNNKNLWKALTIIKVLELSHYREKVMRVDWKNGMIFRPLFTILFFGDKARYSFL